MDEQGLDQTPPAAPVWSLLDRSDPAWRALYDLYSPDGAQQGRAAGLSFSQHNRQAMQRKVVAMAAAAAAAAAAGRVAEQQHKKAGTLPKKVAVPHFKPRVQQQLVDPLAAVPRRRSGQAIQAAMAAEAQQDWGRVPLPSGKLIDEQEKVRCALLMQYKGAIPRVGQLTPAGQAKVAALQARGPCGTTTGTHADAGVDAAAAAQRAGLQQRFQEVEGEVAERQEFVDGLQQLGRLQPEQLHAMRAEVAGKVQEMQQLDGQIKAFDAQLRAQYNESCSSAAADIF